MKNFKKWLDQVYSKHKCEKRYKKENKIKEKKDLPEGLTLTVYIVVIDTVIVMGLITLFIINIL